MEHCARRSSAKTRRPAMRPPLHWRWHRRETCRFLRPLPWPRMGDSLRTQKMADELEKQNPVNTVIIGYWLPTVRAGIAIDRNDAAEAVLLLRAATPYVLGGP